MKYKAYEATACTNTAGSTPGSLICVPSNGLTVNPVIYSIPVVLFTQLQANIVSLWANSVSTDDLLHRCLSVMMPSFM